MTHPTEPRGPAEEVAATAGHPVTPGVVTPPFPPQEVASLHASDVSAGTAIVGLMMGIFAVGLVLYLIVLWWVV